MSENLEPKAEEMVEAAKEEVQKLPEVSQTIEQKFESLVKILADHGIHMG